METRIEEYVMNYGVIVTDFLPIYYVGGFGDDNLRYLPDYSGN